MRTFLPTRLATFRVAGRTLTVSKAYVTMPWKAFEGGVGAATLRLRKSIDRAAG